MAETGMMLVLLFNLVLAGAATYAFVRGGAPEKLVAVAFIAAAAASYFMPPPAFDRFFQFEFGLLMIDTALLLVLIAVALWANRFWPMWIAACQVFTLLTHLTRAYQQDILPIIYFAVVSRIAYLMLIMLVVGTTFHSRRKQRYGSDPDWSHGDR